MPVYSDKSCSDLKCVWMSAGLVKYKLCDQGFNCEHCEFHHAMQGIEHSGTPIRNNHSDISNTHTSQLVNICLNKLLEGCKIHLDRFYHSPHFWFKVEGTDKVQIGIDNLSLKILYPLERCILPQVGEHVQYGQLMGWLVREEMMIPLYAPTKGEITSVNPSYPLNAGKSTDPASDEDPNLLTIKSKELVWDLKQKSFSSEGIENYHQKISCIKAYLQRSLGDQSENIGLTLGDGGTLEQNLEKIMGTKLFREFIHHLFIRK